MPECWDGVSEGCGRPGVREEGASFCLSSRLAAGRARQPAGAGRAAPGPAERRGGRGWPPGSAWGEGWPLRRTRRAMRTCARACAAPCVCPAPGTCRPVAAWPLGPPQPRGRPSPPRACADVRARSVRAPGPAAAPANRSLLPSREAHCAPPWPPGRCGRSRWAWRPGPCRGGGRGSPGGLQGASSAQAAVPRDLLSDRVTGAHRPATPPAPPALPGPWTTARPHPDRTRQRPGLRSE